MAQQPTSRARKIWPVAMGTTVVAVVAAVITVFFVIMPRINDRGVDEQTALNAEYSTAAATLSECLTSSTQVAQVASANAVAFENIIKATVADTTSPTAHVDLKSAEGRNTLLPILAQAWPDVTKQAELFDRVITVVVDCQGDFRGAQTKVQDHVRSFDSWRQGYWADMFGASKFPNDNLIVSIGGNQKVTGLEALGKMRTSIVSETAGNAYRDGTFRAQELFLPNTAVPTTR